MQVNRHPQAGEDFNKSVETFLTSGVNVSRNPKLQNCYNQLIETIYRIEFPSNAQPPQLRSLAANCNWSWNENDYKTADAVAKLVLTAPVETAAANGLITSTATVAANVPAQGFNEQKFEVSPLDELTKLELTPEEQDVAGNPAAHQRYQYLTYQVKTGVVRIVKAKTGDTLTKLAEREGVSAIELARYNGVLPTSILPAGREIKISATNESRQNNARIGNTSATDGKGEANCKTSISPNIQNLQLGMTINEASEKLHKNIPVKKLPNSSPEIYYALVLNLKGVKKLTLNFFKRKLFWIKVNYDNSIEWSGISEFQKTISKTLNLPNVWRGEYSFEKRMSCTNFDIKIVNLSLNDFSLTLTDNKAIKTMAEKLVSSEKKRQEREKSKKENFKP